jgi:penicillin amidase
MSRSSRSIARSRSRRPHGRILILRLAGVLAIAFAPLVIASAVYASYVFVAALQGAGMPNGTISGLGVRAPATIVRDARGIPHIRAANEHDALFLEGYAQATDRLFQMDLYRHLVSGRLTELFGSRALEADERARTYDIDGIANGQLAALPRADRENLQAFADGVNAAMRTLPPAPEFRALFYRPAPWTPKDSLLTSMATVVTLADSWYDVAARVATVDALGPAGKDAFFPISDPKYDSPTTSRVPAPVAPVPALTVPYPNPSPLVVSERDARAGAGSNEFAAGAALTTTHRALLANDPHLELHIPGAWWLVDVETPAYHVAGASLPGVPGVVLGHNAHLAWGATNATVATVSIYRERFKSASSDEYLAGATWQHAQHRRETFRVRFASPVVRDYLRTRHGFIFQDRGPDKLAATWSADVDRRSALPAIDALLRAVNAAQAFAALELYPGPPQNFVVADDKGRVGYLLAGEIPIDDAWGLSAHDGATSPAAALPNVPFARLPQVRPGPHAFVFTANNRTYGAGYPYRLSAAFAPPYRAAQIARDLARPPYDIARFQSVQADVTSPAEAELARFATAALERAHADGDPKLRSSVLALRAFDGRVDGDSQGAVVVTALRYAAVERLATMHLPHDIALGYLSAASNDGFVVLLRMLRARPHGWVPRDDVDGFLVAAFQTAVANLTKYHQLDESWRDFGARIAQHPLASLGFRVWNGSLFPGYGDGFTPHVQGPASTQSFRAVWDVGDWSAGGMVIPLGESGEPASPHYRDAAADWIAGTLVPLPFGIAAVGPDQAQTLRLQP